MPKYIKRAKFKPFTEALKEHKESKKYNMHFDQNINNVKREFYKMEII